MAVVPKDTPALGNRIATFALVSTFFSLFIPFWSFVTLFVCWSPVKMAKEEGLKLDKRVYVAWLFAIVLVLAHFFIVLAAIGLHFATSLI